MIINSQNQQEHWRCIAFDPTDGESEELSCNRETEKDKDGGGCQKAGKNPEEREQSHPNDGQHRLPDKRAHEKMNF